MSVEDNSPPMKISSVSFFHIGNISVFGQTDMEMVEEMCDTIKESSDLDLEFEVLDLRDAELPSLLKDESSTS